LETLAAVVVAVFVLEIILPAYNYFDAQWMITTPALEIHDGYRVGAIAVGAVLMLLIAAARLIERSTLAQAAAALAIVAAAGRARLCAGWLLVARRRELGGHGRRHGRGRAGAVPGDEAARGAAGRARGAAVLLGRDVGDHPAEPRADHDRLGHRRVDRGAVHR